MLVPKWSQVLTAGSTKPCDCNVWTHHFPGSVKHLGAGWSHTQPKFGWECFSWNDLSVPSRTTDIARKLERFSHFASIHCHHTVRIRFITYGGYMGDGWSCIQKKETVSWSCLDHWNLHLILNIRRQSSIRLTRISIGQVIRVRKAQLCLSLWCDVLCRGSNRYRFVQDWFRSTSKEGNHWPETWCYALNDLVL